jgi:hypothetical protein
MLNGPAWAWLDLLADRLCQPEACSEPCLSIDIGPSCRPHKIYLAWLGKAHLACSEPCSSIDTDPSCRPDKTCLASVMPATSVTRVFFMIRVDSRWVLTCVSFIRFVMSLAFCAYVECLKRSSDVTCLSVLARMQPGFSSHMHYW